MMPTAPDITIDLTRLGIDELDHFAERIGMDLEDYVQNMDQKTLKCDGVPLRKFLRTVAEIAMLRLDRPLADAGQMDMMEVLEMVADSNPLTAEAAAAEARVEGNAPTASD